MRKTCLFASWKYPTMSHKMVVSNIFNISLWTYIILTWFSFLLFQLVKDYQAWASGDSSRKPLGTGKIWSSPVPPLGMVVYLLYSNPAPAWTSSTSLPQCLYAQLVEVSHCCFLLQLFSYQIHFLLADLGLKIVNGAFAMKIIVYEQWTIICAPHTFLGENVM